MCMQLKITQIKTGLNNMDLQAYRLTMGTSSIHKLCIGIRFVVNGICYSGSDGKSA